MKLSHKFHAQKTLALGVRIFTFEEANSVKYTETVKIILIFIFLIVRFTIDGSLSQLILIWLQIIHRLSNLLKPKLSSHQWKTIEIDTTAKINALTHTRKWN